MSTRIQKVYGRTPKEARQKAQKEFGNDFSVIKMNRVSGKSLLKPDKHSNYELIISIESEVETTAPLIRPQSDVPDPNKLKDAISRVNTLLTASAYSKHAATETPSSQVSHQARTDLPDLAEESARHEAYGDPPEFADEAPSDKTDRSRSGGEQQSDLFNYLGSELTEIRDVLHILLNNVKATDTPDLPDEVTGLYQKFLKHDIDQIVG